MFYEGRYISGTEWLRPAIVISMNQSVTLPDARILRLGCVSVSIALARESESPEGETIFESGDASMLLDV